VTIKGRRVTRAFAIGTTPVLSIAAGKTQIAHIKLDAAVRALLRGHQELRVELALATPGRKRAESVVLVGRGALNRK